MSQLLLIFSSGHSPTSRVSKVPDRESNEIKYLREATDLIEKWQHQLQDGQPVSQPSSEHSEVILVERQRLFAVPLCSGLVCLCVCKCMIHRKTLPLVSSIDRFLCVSLQNFVPQVAAQ